MNFVLIAHKFNDAFYGVFSDEYNLADKRFLIIVEAGFVNENNFPFKGRFDEVFVISKYSKNSVLRYLFQIIKIKQVVGTKSSIVAFSNPILIINQVFARLLKADSIILLEDGVMNYRNYIPSKSYFKSILQTL